MTINGLSADTSMNEGDSVLLTGSAAHAGNEGLAYSWTATRNGQAFGTPGTQPTWTFNPTDDGTYVVTLTVSDWITSTSAAETIQVLGQAPTGSMIPALSPNSSVYVVPQGTAFTFGLANVVDPSLVYMAAGFKYSYDLDGDGVFEIPDSTSSTVSVTITTCGVRR